MSRTHRLFQLMQCLRGGGAPHTAAALARELAVSARTIHRDIDTLRGLGAVIDGAAGYGFTLIEDLSLPPLSFDDDESEALVLGLREVQQIGDPDLAAAAGRALAKLQSRLPPRQSHRLQHAVLSARRFQTPAPPGVPVALLRRATRDELAVDFAYRDEAGTPTQRRVNPLGMVYMDSATVLVAWCHLRRDYRVFRLDRMAGLAVSEQSFRPRRVAMLREAMARLRASAR